MHSPEPSLMGRFVADGVDLLLAGHPHGGQVCLPGFGTLVTNCGIDPARAKGLHQHPAGPRPRERAFPHVSARLRTSPPPPARPACRPAATLLPPDPPPRLNSPPGGRG